jgi:preprotein translocase subunit SecG
MVTLFFSLQIILGIVIIGLVLLQKAQSMGFGAYSSSNDTFFGAKGPMNFFAKVTIVFGIAFVLNTLTLVYLYNTKLKVSALDKVQIKTEIPKVPLK